VRRRDKSGWNVVLALQGGSAHGAYIWGVVDRLLEEDGPTIEGVTGTSSGAVNAALLAYGLIDGDRQAARDLLGRFWRRISEESEARRWTAHMLLRLLRPHILRIGQKAGFFDVMARILLPYDFDPSTMEPLRSVIDECIDFDRLRSADTIGLFVNATDIETTDNRVFTRAEMTLDAVCASCCLPFLFEAVEIDGRQYWDGGYMGNPTIYPVIYEGGTDDVILVLSAPLGIGAVPETSAGILSRVTQISFSSALQRELRAINFVTDLLDRDLVKPKSGLRRITLHRIEPAAPFDDGRKNRSFDAEWSFLRRLCDRGRADAERFLQTAPCYGGQAPELRV
jgi:NTE family protein